MIVAIGVDSIAIRRIDDLWQRAGARFLERIFTDAERAYCLSRHRPAESLAARFCAKEAVMKCLGSGWAMGLGFRQIEVERDGSGAVRVRLTGEAAARAAARSIRVVHLSMTHTGDVATAFAVAQS